MQEVEKKMTVMENNKTPQLVAYNLGLFSSLMVNFPTCFVGLFSAYNLQLQFIRLSFYSTEVHYEL